MPARINTFIVYAREDTDIKQALVLHLNPLRNPDYNMEIWHDEYIEAGEDWQKKIKERLEHTDIFLLLISIHFMNSEFIREVEFEAAIDRHKNGKSTVIPVIIKPCLWKVNLALKNYKFSLSELQVLPDGAKALDEWNSLQQGLNNIAAGVLKVVETLQQKLQISQQEAEKKETEERKKIEEQKAQAAKEEDDELTWRKSLESGNNKLSLRDYLDKYPAGKYSVLAYQKINALEIQEKEATEKNKRDREKSAWNEAKERNTPSSYNKYLKTYPDGVYKKQAIAKVTEATETKRLEAEKIESELWREVKAKNNIPSYNKYLQSYPDGKYRNQANTKITELKNEATETKRREAEKKNYRPGFSTAKSIATRIKPSDIPATEKKDFLEDYLWWLLLPLVIALSVGSLYLGQYFFTTLDNWLNIPWQVRSPSNTLLIIIGCVWGIAYAVIGASENEYNNVSLMGLFLPYENIFMDGNGSFMSGIFSAPVINIIIIQTLLTGINYLLGHLLGWDSQVLYVILFIVVNAIAMLVYSTDYD